MERRNFIRNTGLFAGGLLLDTGKLFAGSPSAPLKMGIIGCGDRGKGIMQVLSQMPDKYKVTAICDVLDFRLNEARKYSGESVKSYKEYRRLLEDKNVEAVVIAVPLNMHYPIAIDALSADKHLYLEKTMTYNIPQALELVRLAKARPHQVVQIGHQYRYSPLYYRVKEMITKGYLGDISQIDCRWDRNGDWRRAVPDPSLERQINWRLYKEYSGGLVAELLSHQIDFINWAFETHPTEIFATGGIDVFNDGRETFDNVQVMFRYEGSHQMIGNFGATCGNAHDGYLFRIKGTLGTVSLLTDEGMFYPEKKLLNNKEVVDGVTGATRIVWNKEGGTPILPERTKDGTWYAFNEFYKSVQSQSLPDSNVFTGARTAISVHLANAALYDKKPAVWKDDYNFL